MQDGAREDSWTDKLNDPLTISLVEWINLLENEKPRSLGVLRSEDVEAVVYTDGYFPDHRKGEAEEPRVGGVIFSRDRERPVAFSTQIPREAMDMWISRKTQIVRIEAIALPTAAETFREMIRGKTIIWLIDSDPVLGAAVKGYSGKEDVCSCISSFWEILREETARVYLDRIPTDGNLSDGPSRADWFLVGQCGWATVQARIPESLKCKSKGGQG